MTGVVPGLTTQEKAELTRQLQTLAGVRGVSIWGSHGEEED